MILGPPEQIDEATRAFCAAISSAEPFYIDLVPSPRAKPAYCFQNSQIHAVQEDGTAVFGWAIWRWPGRWFEAEHHAVFRDAEGAYLDVTPQPGDPARILFLPDPAAVYDPRIFRANVMAPETGNQLAAEYVDLAARRVALTRPYWRPCCDHLALIAPHDWTKIEAIDARMAELRAAMDLTPPPS